MTKFMLPTALKTTPVIIEDQETEYVKHTNTLGLNLTSHRYSRHVKEMKRKAHAVLPTVQHFKQLKIIKKITFGKSLYLDDSSILNLPHELLLNQLQ